MEINKEFIEKYGLNDDAVKELTEIHNNSLAEAKKEFEEKYKGEANKNAENILSGAAEQVAKTTGIKRNEGEKIADYISRSSSSFLSEQQSKLEKKQIEIDKKLEEIKNSGGNEQLKEQLETLKTEKDELLKKYADFDSIATKAQKADELETQLNTLTKTTAFQSVKPTFPKEVNQYEAKAKWDEFQKSVLEQYNVVMDEGEAICIDKENHHRTLKLSELVEKNEQIQELMQGRQQMGSGGKQEPITTQIDGVPFKVPENATTAQRSAAIKDYLLQEGLSVTSREYSEKFAQYNEAIRKAMQ